MCLVCKNHPMMDIYCDYTSVEELVRRVEKIEKITDNIKKRHNMQMINMTKTELLWN